MAVELTDTFDLGAVLATRSTKTTRPRITNTKITLFLRQICALGGLPGATVLSAAGEGAPRGGQHQQHQPEGEPRRRGHDGGPGRKEEEEAEEGARKMNEPEEELL